MVRFHTAQHLLANKIKKMAKTYKVSKSEMVKEHSRIIPELKKAGLKKEACKQTKELKEIKKK